MSQTNSIPRPSFWKVPADNKNDMHRYRVSGPQQYTSQYQQQQSYPLANSVTATGMSSAPGTYSGIRGTSAYAGASAVVTTPTATTTTRGLLKKHRNPEKSKKRVRFRDTVDQYNYLPMPLDYKSSINSSSNSSINDYQSSANGYHSTTNLNYYPTDSLNPYRTTPLVLPGAKVKKDAPTTESYLRHYPNPAVRARPHHDFHDSVMKQRVADTMLHKVVGQDADTGKVFHKQFNSPIGLYSENNIENTIRQTVPYKPTVLYDPSKSETFKAVQEAGYDHADYSEEVTVPVQPKVFQPHKTVPGKKLLQSAPVSHTSYHVVNSHDETIRQSGSFNRLMHSVLGQSTY
ncbi:PDZ_signaling and DUF4749 domain-containing protein Zasp66 isoform X4 [Musca autumnalis]|uniref:PDZ_signaling and DUF4749 domain-containing protein Zasp66 isoform X4 n=1 Tax=Musca autumnalis TaxID=221902 RepID=UPI003CEB2F83